MKKYIKKLVKIIIKKLIPLVSYLYSYKLTVRFENLKNEIVSNSLSRTFKNCGRNFLIDRPYTLQGLQYISIGDNVHLHSNIRLEAIDEFQGVTYNPIISIGNNVIINQYCHIGIISKLTIEDGVLIAGKVFITDHFHGDTEGKYLFLPPAERPLISKGEVIIEDNVWIGEGVCIMPNVTIGYNSIIGANSVVTKDVLPNTVVGGIPAKIIKVLSK